MTRLFFCPSLVFLLLGTCSVEVSDESMTRSREHRLGSSRLRTTLHEFPGSDLVFFNMHDDENTAVEAGLNVLGREGGKLLELEHSGERLVRFDLNDEVFTIDPNRIFTDEGIRKTLERNSRLTPAAFEAVRKTAQEILTAYDLLNQPLIVTLHNNQEDGYSAASYQAGGSYALDAAAVFIAEGKDPDDFFFVTTVKLYNTFMKAGWNVVLQDNQKARDDGSLSVLAGERGIPYINIEAQHQHRQAQEEMIRAVLRLAH